MDSLSTSYALVALRTTVLNAAAIAGFIVFMCNKKKGASKKGGSDKKEKISKSSKKVKGVKGAPIANKDQSVAASVAGVPQSKSMGAANNVSVNKPVDNSAAVSVKPVDNSAAVSVKPVDNSAAVSVKPVDNSAAVSVKPSEKSTQDQVSKVESAAIGPKSVNDAKPPKSASSQVHPASDAVDAKESSYVLKPDDKIPASQIAKVDDTNNLVLSDLAIVPTELRFTGKGGQGKIALENKTGKRLALKLKCSDNGLYRLNHVFKLMEIDEKMTVDVSRLEGKVKPDKLVVVFAEADADITNAQDLFKSSPAASCLRTATVPLFVN